MRTGPKFYWNVLKSSFGKFSEADVLTHSAALSYYTIFSLPPMLLVILKTMTQFYSEAQVKETIFGEIGGLVGRDGAQALMGTLDKLNVFQPTWWATALGIGVLVFTATTVFVTMQNALNLIFEVKASNKAKGWGILKMLRDRVISFALIVSVAFILLVSLVVDALITKLSQYLDERWGYLSTTMVVLTSMLLPLAIITLLFAMLFKFLPDAKLAWRDTWFGALVTALLFSLGKYLIGFYIGSSHAASVYEAAGSVLVVMLWVYYASAIFLFGGTFTFMRAKLLNGRVKPQDYAVRVKKSEIKMETGADVAAAASR
jgi:membrane protein